MWLFLVFNRHLNPFASIELMLELSRIRSHAQHTTTTHNYTQQHTTTQNNAQQQQQQHATIIMSEVDWSGRVVDVVGIGIGDRALARNMIFADGFWSLMSVSGSSGRRLW